MEQLTIRQTQSIEPEQNHYPLDSQKSEDSCKRQLQVSPQPKLYATIIDTNHSHEIPVGKPIYACTKSQKELRSLKICYSVCTLFIITLLLARIIPQFIYDGYVLSAIVWILCSSLYLFNFTIFFLFIDKRTLFVLNTWIIVNCIIFITDLIGTVLGLGSPLYKGDCEESMWKDEAENCETKKKFKTAFSIIYIVFLLINGIIYGIYCYRAYKIRKLLRFQEKLSARLPSSTQIQC